MVQNTLFLWPNTAVRPALVGFWTDSMPETGTIPKVDDRHMMTLQKQA